jgi:hypothetical protein
MEDGRQRPGVVSPEFAKIMLSQIPIGALMVVVALVREGQQASLLLWAGLFVVAYSVLGASVIWLLIRRRRVG